MHVPADLEERIRQKIDSGLYDDPDAVMRMALRLLDKRDQRLQELRASIAGGLAAIERGEGKELTPELLEEISQEASKRARLGMSPKPDVCP
jgi:putative addiction module CopG family antidote